MKENQELNDNSLTLVSIGSLTGMGIAFIISSFFGGSIVIGLIMMGIGLHSLKRHWFLLKN